MEHAGKNRERLFLYRWKAYGDQAVATNNQFFPASLGREPHDRKESGSIGQVSKSSKDATSLWTVYDNSFNWNKHFFFTFSENPAMMK